MVFNFIVGTLAAVGLACILWSVYGLLFAGFPRAGDCAELYLYLDGASPRAEQLLRTAHRARREYLPGIPIVFIDTGEGCEPLRQLAAQLGIEYFNR
ncbi:hypothetical protein D7X33_16110 [Butyricicoccus sp. 1XD8-22]|nr:hypothetical protein D7X33_16110 [Butyricicoccus sp. 1XD8-22]